MSVVEKAGRTKGSEGHRATASDAWVNVRSKLDAIERARASESGLSEVFVAMRMVRQEIPADLQRRFVALVDRALVANHAASRDVSGHPDILAVYAETA